MWGIACNIDTALELEYREGGYPRVCVASDHDDRMEHWLSRRGSQFVFWRTGDAAVLRSLLSGRAPGEDILPD